MLYPDVKHNWLCDGKLLRLLDPIHPSNYKMFNQRWKQGELRDKSFWIIFTKLLRQIVQLRRNKF